MSPVAILSVGLLLGLKHALEADHLVAVSTIVARTASPWQAARVGAIWGCGHALSLAFVGVLFLSIGAEIPVPAGKSLECLVAVMLIILGLLTLRDGRREKLHYHPHSHSTEVHTHLHPHLATPSHRHHDRDSVGARPLCVGLVHGVAGSAGLMLLVLSSVSSPAEGLLYVLVFGCGSILGMIGVSVLIGGFLSMATSRVAVADQTIRLTAGAVSIFLGAWMMVDVAVVEGFFLL